MLFLLRYHVDLQFNIQEIDDFCTKEILLYVETSALTGEGVSDLFIKIALRVQESMTSDVKTGFQLLEMKTENSDQVYCFRW